MTLVQSLLLLLTFMHFGASAASRYYSESDFADATDIRLECCSQNWGCCEAYKRNISQKDRATTPPLPRSQKNPLCTLAKARREKSQALQGATMLDILIAIQVEYHTILELEWCFPTHNIHRRRELIGKIGVTREILERNTYRCCLSHLKNNHTARLNELIKKAENFRALQQDSSHIKPTCKGHIVTNKRLFFDALHRLGQQLKALECLESLSSYKRSFCLDICIREKSVQKCIDQWL